MVEPPLFAEPETTTAWGGLEPWLASTVDGYEGPAAVRRFQGGQSNPTYKLEAPSGSYVLRKKPNGALLPSAHAVDREHRVMSALSSSGVPVPTVRGLCSDETIIGTPFFVMDFVPGRIFFDQTLPGLRREERAAIFDSMNETIARLHRTAPVAVGLEDYGRPSNFLERQIARWSKQYRASETHPIAAMDHLMEWLPRFIPPQAPGTIVHGDYRLDNLIIHPSEPRVIAVLDWELSTLGDPIADFAYHVMAWRIPPQVFRGLGGIDLTELGIPDEASYVARYCDRTGRSSIPSWDFYMVYSMFRIAAIIQGIAKRALNGNASGADAFKVGDAADPIAEQAWTLAKSIERAE